MPAETKRLTKVDRLVAAYERLGEELTGIPDQRVQRLRSICLGVRSFVADAKSRDPSLRSSQIAAGLEQGLRETLTDLASTDDKQWRTRVVQASRLAITAHYPDFLAEDAEKFEKIRARGRIRTEAEFYLVRHQIDEAEGAENQRLLGELYRLVDEYEARGG
jgi:hypothetical protein